MNLRELQKEAHAIAVAKGSYDRDDAVTFGDRIASIHSKLSKALETYRERELDAWVEPRVVEKDPPPPPWDRRAFTHEVCSKPCGVAAELADVMIRVACMAEHYGVWVEAAYQRASVGAYPIPQLETFGEWVTYVHSWASRAASKHWQARAEDEEDIPYWADAIGEVIRGVVYISAHYGIDLDAAIAAKMEYMRGRAGC